MNGAAHAGWEQAIEACLDGEISPVQDAAVRQHLHDCPDCDSHATFLLALRGSLRRVVARLPPLSRDRLERLAEHFHNPSRPAQ